MEWELVPAPPGLQGRVVEMYRTRTPKGWLVYASQPDENYSPVVSMCVVMVTATEEWDIDGA